MELVILFGPPAVGKMTVGHELCKLTGFKLLHNHMTVDPVLEIFPFGSPPFLRLVGEFRRRILEEAMDAGLTGLVFTYVWGLDLDEDTRLIRSYLDLAASRDSRVRLVELYADQQERLRRNVTEFRLSRKPTHRDRDFSRQILLDFDRDYVLNTGGDIPTRAGDLLAEHGHLRLDNTHLEATDAARLIADHFGF
ncbi:MAG: hypothetical protein QOK15_1842 [Nocardioidaceae bacterium]|nr:hypothetical protein [Nocardioidaceae bacterium]